MDRRNSGEDYIWTHVKKMLKTSPEPDAEEWAIHDHSGFEDAFISEWESFSDIAKFASFIEEHGEHVSLAMYAQQLTEDCQAEIPDNLSLYTDYAAMGRDMEMSGDIFTIEISYDEIHVFWAH